MRVVYVIDFRDDATGIEDRLIFGTRARARAFLRREGYKPDGDYEDQWARLTDADFGNRAHIVREVVR